ncbi:hypothetical protein ACTXT7_006354 [Hymenolepis weldensis]
MSHIDIPRFSLIVPCTLLTNSSVVVRQYIKIDRNRFHDNYDDFLMGDLTKDQCNRVRHVTVHRGPAEELGISITGGLEYGVPILISEIIPNQVVHCSGEFYIGDAILAINGNDLRDKRHHEAADILAAQQV